MCLAVCLTCRPVLHSSLLQVFSSLRAAKKLIQDQQLRPLLLLHPDALPEFDGIDCCQPNAVVVGLAQQAFSYDSMNAAFRLLLQQPQAPLIAIHKAKYYKAADGQLALGPGPYAAALEFATGRTAQVCLRCYWLGRASSPAARTPLCGDLHAIHLPNSRKPSFWLECCPQCAETSTFIFTGGF